MANPNGPRREALQNAMVAAGMSPRELTRSSGFLRHQIDDALAGRSKISPYVYECLMKHIVDHQAEAKEAAVTQIVQRST